MRRLALLLVLVAATPAEAAFTAKATNDANRVRAAATFKPKLLTAPTISGTTRQKQTLTATDGTWERQPTSFERAWLRCDVAGDNCTPIAGATGQTYVLAGSDVHHRIRVRVTAINAGGRATTVSASTVEIDPPQNFNPPQPFADPSVNGLSLVDERLTASPGTWSGVGNTYAYQWQRCAGSSCTDVTGETSVRYDVVGADVGSTFRVRVTATNDGGSTTRVSATTAAIARRSYTQVLCADPNTGQGVGGDGYLPDGMSAAVDRWEMGNIEGRSYCSGTMTTQRGIHVRPYTRVWGTGWAQTGATLRYRAPSQVGYLGADVYRRLYFNGAITLIGGINMSSSDWVYASPRAEFCEMNTYNCAGYAQNATQPFSGTGVAVGASNQINGFNMFVRCGGADNSWTCGADTWHGYTFYGARVALLDSVDPKVTGAVTGTLATATTTGTTATVAFPAADGESGVYRVRVRVDGEQVASQIVSTNGGKCVDVNPDNTDGYEFAFARPCATSTNVSASWSTASWPKGEHRVQVVLEDAGRNTVSVVNRTMTITS